MSFKYQYLLFFLFTFTFFFTSCKRPKTVSATADVSYPPCVVEEIDFVYFSMKSKLHYKDKSNDQKTNINIRIRKDSIIWISVNAAAGFEAFRIMLSQDSIHILDRLNNVYTQKDFETLSKNIGIELNYKMLQGILLGNLMSPKAPQDHVIKSDTSHCIFTQINGPISITNYVSTPISKVDKVEITNNIDLLTINYLKFAPLANFTFALENEIVLKHKEDSDYQFTKIHIEHNKCELSDKELNFPFNIPNKFERK